MIDQELLKIICCPETHQAMALADSAVVDKINQQITGGTTANRSGQKVAEKIDGGLVRADGKYLYPIRKNIPVLLIEEGIALS